MESPKSLKVTTGIFIFFLTVSGLDHVDKIYIPLKQSIAGQHIPEACIYSAELIAFILFGLSLIKVVSNIGKQKFFIKQNVNCFRFMGLSMMLPPVAKTLGRIFDNTHDWAAYPMYIELWFAVAIFMAIMSNIFEYGMKLKEEQDLTI